MLSQHDRRALAEIEARLRDSDPGLARRLESSPEPWPPHARHPGRRILAAGLLLGLVLLTTGFAAHNADAAVSAAVVLATVLAGTVLCTAAWFKRHQG